MQMTLTAVSACSLVSPAPPLASVAMDRRPTFYLCLSELKQHFSLLSGPLLMGGKAQFLRGHCFLREALRNSRFPLNQLKVCAKEISSDREALNVLFKPY